MANRLSYSQIRLYSECSKRYYYHYKLNLRPKTKSGALLFGSAFDRAIQEVLLNPDGDEKAVFDQEWTYQEMNGKKTYLPDCTLIRYSDYDPDYDLLDEFELQQLKDFCVQRLPNAFNEKMAIFDIYAMLKSYHTHKHIRKMSDDEIAAYNFFCWLCMRKKGYLMLDAHRAEILPSIKKVIGVQHKFELKNEEGDSFIGFIDLHCVWADDQEVVIDYKTSSIGYTDDSVMKSSQLAVYAHALNLKRAGYLVFDKNISKNKQKICMKCGKLSEKTRAHSCTEKVDGERCHGEFQVSMQLRARVRVIIDDINPRTEEIVVQNMEDINQSIKQNVYIRNFNACEGKFGRCPYFNLCYKNDPRGLDGPPANN